MAGSATNAEIEDVLASIRRLVMAGDGAPGRAEPSRPLIPDGILTEASDSPVAPALTEAQAAALGAGPRPEAAPAPETKPRAPAPGTLALVSARAPVTSDGVADQIRTALRDAMDEAAAIEAERPASPAEDAPADPQPGAEPSVAPSPFVGRLLLTEALRVTAPEPEPEALPEPAALPEAVAQPEPASLPEPEALPEASAPAEALPEPQAEIPEPAASAAEEPTTPLVLTAAPEPDAPKADEAPIAAPEPAVSVTALFGVDAFALPTPPLQRPRPEAVAVTAPQIALPGEDEAPAAPASAAPEPVAPEAAADAGLAALIFRHSQPAPGPAAARDEAEDEEVAFGAELDQFLQSPPALDEDVLRRIVAEVLREELQGALGERITRNIRKLVRREIYRTLNEAEQG